MITGASTPGADWFLNGLNNTRNQEAITTRQISSGLRVQTAADSPGQIVDLVGLNSSLARNDANSTNYISVQSELQTSDHLLSSAISVVESARTLGLQGANGTATPATQQAVAAQVQGLLQQIVSLGNTPVNGRYLFSGDTPEVQPFVADINSASGYTYQGSTTSTRQILDSNGGAIYTAATGQQVFDHRDSGGLPTADNVLVNLQNLVQALQTNTGIGAAVSSLESSSTYLNQQQSNLAAGQNNLTAAQNEISTQKTNLQTQISQIRDADIAQAAIDLNTEKVAESAALAAQGGLSHKSLFDYMG